MSQYAKEITSINIEDELKQSYLDYAMSVIVSRALPDVRDGLKPVHRRILYAMRELGNEYNKPYKKSARIVGDVIGKYHPHGDVAVYETIVRMAQSFSLRYPLIDGQGNFGSIDGDAPAAMRYTEIRLAKIAHFLLTDLDKNTVDFAPNYDGTEFAPQVLPAALPNLLINGSSGIAVGMATNIPPHNLGEVIDACIAVIDKPEIELQELIKTIPGPDFPTAGIINGRGGIEEAYRTGRGKIYVRSRVTIETDATNDKQAIVINELPYQVNKANLLERIAELVKEKKIEGITAVRDESDKEGMRVVIELRRGEITEIILNNLFINTQMQVTFGVNIVALENGQPKTLNLKQLLEAFLNHRREVVTRRCIFELKEARMRAHILEGLGVALTNIDEIITLIKESKNPAIAKQELLSRVWHSGDIKAMLEASANISQPDDLDKKFGMSDEGYRLSEAQVQAILDLRLHRLTNLEQDKIISEYKELLSSINVLLAILAKPNLLLDVIRKELLEIKKLFADTRRTEIIETQEDLTREDLVVAEDVVVTISHEGYAKIQAITDYQAQRRGGKGKIATKVKEEDFIEKLFIANTHDTILCFSNRGKVYWLKVYLLPQGSRTPRGKPLVNLLPLEEGEQINTILPVKEYLDNSYIFMATALGTVKKVTLKQFSNPRSNGIIAVDLLPGDNLIGVDLTDGKREVMLFSDAGRAVRFNEEQVRAMGRTARGVRGMKIKDDQKIIALIIVEPESAILIATANGYGKRTLVSDFPNVNRSAQGVIAIQVSKRNGKAVSAILVNSSNEIMLISDRGTLVRTRVDEISLIGRNTQGVKLINISGEEHLVGVQRVEEQGEDTDG
ncbi:MAG: DNA gyrase subunit A [Coxiellaceae bacterium]|jgi:DNA gyrase subunit A|nr:DNA gyrase subunit A [Coxiellaceae bacterium]